MFQLQKSRKFSNIGIVLLIALTAFFAFGQTPVATDIRPLPLNKTVEREIKAAEEHFYTIKLKKGEVLRLELQEGQVVNYIFRLIKADNGQTITESDLTTKFGRDAITYIASAKESLKVLVKAPEKIIAGSAAYKLTGAISKRATDFDKERIKAEELSREASKLSEDALKLPTGNRRESYRKAVTLAEEALNLRRKQADKFWEGWTLNFLGNFYRGLGDSQKALGYYEQSLAISREIKDRRIESAILNSIGRVYSYELQQYEKAKNYYEQALAIARELKARRSEADILDSLGFVYQNTNQSEKALQFYQQALAIFQEIKDYDGEAATLFSISIYYYGQNQIEKGREIGEQVMAIRRKTNDKKGESQILLNLGFSNLYHDQHKATKYFEQKLVVDQEINDKQGQTLVLGMLAYLSTSLNRFDKAMQYFERSVLIAREIKDLNREIGALYGIGDLYFGLKNFEKAREYYEKAANLIPQKDPKELADLDFLPLLYYRLKQYEKAEEAHKRVFEREKNRFKELAAVAVAGIVEVYKEQKQYEKAREYLEKVLAFYREKKDRDFEATILLVLGKLYQDQKQYEKAREYFEQSLAILSDSRIPSYQVIPIFQLGNLYLEQKQYEKARGYLEQSIAKMQEANLFEQIDVFAIFPAMVDLYTGLKNPQLAIYYGKQEVNKYQNVRTEIKGFDKNTQLTFVKDKEPAYRKLADLLISEGRLPEAQAVLDLLKEEEYRNFTVRRSGETPNTVPYSKAESDVAAKIENLAKSERERSELLKLKEQGALSADKQSRLDQIPAEIEAANRAFRLALDALGKSESSVESKVAEIKSEQNLQRALAQLQKETGSSVAALYTVLGTEEPEGGENTDGARAKTKFGWIILVTPNLRKAYPIDVAELEQIVFQFRETLQSDKYNPQPLAEKLYQKLFRQTSAKQKVTLEADLETLLGKSKDKTLMWSLDGILRYVPMAALHDGNGYLVEKYRNVVFTKESFLTLTAADNSKWQALGLGVSEGGKNYSALPGAEKELRDIVREEKAATGILDGVIKLNKDFAEEATVRLWREGKYPVIHIASHYAFNPTDPTSSYLLLGDGQLTFSEMQDKDNLFGTIDLLTLSACDTAMTGNGKEAEGFAYLAQSLGAKSVIASLWKVSDAGTPELMIRFYKLRAENPQMAKGEAFRLAQLSLLNGDTKNTKTAGSRRSELIQLSREKSALSLFVKDEKKPLAHPHYWSSFVLIGNWR